MPRADAHARPIAVYGAVVANSGIAIAKFVAAALTGSSAMLSEGIHSVVDSANQGLLLLGISRSKAPPDEDHPFGHGKELYFWSLVVAIVLFGVGGGLAIYEGVIHTLEPTPVEDPIVSYVVLGLAFVLELGSFAIAVRELLKEANGRSLIRTLRYSKDPSLPTVLFEDSAALFGLVAAFVGILLAEITGDPRFDGLGSLVIGAVLALVAIVLAYESRGLLIGERAASEVIEQVHAVAQAHPGVARVVEVRSMHVGARRVIVNLRVAFSGDRTSDVETAVAKLHASLEQIEGGLLDVTIEPVAPGVPPIAAADNSDAIGEQPGE
jgi:cation diffusion facilitator family transporter